MEATLSLVKGEKIDLTKTNPDLKHVAVGMGWDAPEGGKTYDLDAFAIPLKGGKLLESEVLKGVVYFNHKSLFGIEHQGDNLTGAGDGDDETINIELAKLTAAGVEEVLLCVNIYDAVNKGNQNFGQVKNAFIRVYDVDTKKELTKFDLSEDYSKYNAMTMGKLYLRDAEWKFQAIGEGGNGNVEQIAHPYAK